ncbi:PspC domain-containing protein [Bacteroidota bacterium]
MSLKRSNERYLGGVCGGIAEEYNLSPLLVRTTWTILSLISFIIPGLIVYLIFWITMNTPEE